MLVRGALCRLAAPKQAAHGLPKLTTLVQTARASSPLPVRSLSRVLQLQTRSYASETVKKAVKAKAAAGESVTKTTTAKKPAAKKATKKAAPKKAEKKAAPKKKKAAARPKKQLTDEEKLKKTISDLRKLALKEPVGRNVLTAHNIYVAEKLKAAQGDQANINQKLTAISKSFKDITPAEHERLNHLAAERNESRAAEYKAWVESYTPDQIRIANNARRLLRKKVAERFAASGRTRKRNTPPVHTQPIEDDRRVKRPQVAWSVFFTERFGSPDFKGIALREKVKLMSEEWKALDANEKQRFEDQAAADRQRWARETAALAKA